MIFACCALFLAAQTLTAADLQRAGVVRLGDLFRLADGWASSSIEGFTIEGEPPGFAPGGSAAYALYVDGVPVEFDLLGTTSPNRLPIPVEAIESVTFETRPSLARGRFAPASIRLVMRRPVRRVEFRGRHAAGSEAGDPGPFQFTQDASPNVERFGFESAAALGGRGASFWGDATFLRARHYASDEAILRRWIAIGGEDVRVIEKEAPSFRIGWEKEARDAGSGERAATPSALFTGFASSSSIDEKYFARPLAREFAVESAFREWGARGSWRAPSSLSPSFDASFTSTTNRLDASEGGGTPAIDWKASSHIGDFVARMTHGVRAAELGVRAGRFHVAAGDSTLRDEARTRGGLFARFASGDVSDDAALDLSFEGGRGGASHAIVFSRTHGAIDFTFAEAQVPRADAAPFWFWRERGLAALDDAGTALASGGGVRAASLVAGDLGVTIRAGASAEARVAAFARRGRDLALEETQVDADSLGFPRATSTMFFPEEQGTVAGASVVANVRVADNMAVRGAWRVQEAVDGTRLFRDGARRTPKHLGRASIVVSPSATFDLEVAVRARSGSVWLAYAQAARVPATSANADLPGWAAVDLSCSKWFARRRFRAGLAFRDLFDRPLRTHPIGEIERLTVVAQAEVAL